MTLDECDRLFAQVRDESSASAICHALQPLLDSYEVLNIELGRSAVFWRARFAGAQPWESVKEMSYPPLANARPGRLNDENTPCLYAATHGETALLEIGVKENDVVQLVGFRAKLETPIRIAVIGELLHVHKTGHLRLTGHDPTRSIHRYLNSLGIKRGQALLYIDAFLAHLLADAEAKNSGYVRSRALASMIYRNPDIDGIMFPSVQDPLGMNLALRPAPSDSKLHPVCCWHLTVNRIRAFGFIEYDVTGEAEQIAADGKFVWASYLERSRRRFFNLTKEEYDAATRNPDDPNTFLKVMNVHNDER